MIKVEKVKGEFFPEAYKLTFRYDPITVDKIKQLSQRRYLPEERAWEIPLTELQNLIAKVGVANLSMAENVLPKTDDEESRRAEVRKRLAGIKPVVDFKFKTVPLPHQIESFNFGMNKNSFLLGDTMGLGKTKESIDIAVARKDELHKCLIVCGVNSVKYNWQSEIKKHSDESSFMIDGKTMDKRVEQINDWYMGEEFFGIINIESIRNEKIQDALYIGIQDGQIGAVIVDEIHKAKNGSSQQGKALRALRAPVKIGLSGTPMNKPEDLWNILTWLGAEKRSFYAFRNTYCVMGGYGGYNVVGYKNLETLSAQLNKVMLRRTKEEVLDLPPKTHLREYVELTARQRSIYKDIKQGIIDQLEDILQSLNPLSCTLRLRQLTSGLFSEDNPKLDRIKDMLENEIIPNGQKAIIFSQWEHITSVYLEALKEYNPIYITGKVSPEERQREVERFQNDESCKLAIGTIGAMGTGLTLNRASYVFFTDKSWVNGDNEQAEDRAHRIGTTGTVNIISMIAKDTVDEGIEDYLAENKEIFSRVVDGKGNKQEIRALLQKLLQM
jgi:SNF2 family DNA or RNA helicase